MQSRNSDLLRWAVLLLFAGTGCSLALDWDKEGQPCDGQRRCLTGYSCLGSVCVADGSVARGETCSFDAQCNDGLVCASVPFFGCRTPCSSFYDGSASGDCGAGEYCRPYQDPNQGSASEWHGACVPSECGSNIDCRQDEVCVKITGNASACLKRCVIEWSGTAYLDNCSTAPTSPEYCQPIGAQDAQKLVCLPTTPTAQGKDGLCTPIEAPCRSGLACIRPPGDENGTCKTHCKPSSAGGFGEQCSGSEQCLDKTNSTPIYAVCE